jgi:DNA-binding transcriptional regulator YiaG
MDTTNTQQTQTTTQTTTSGTQTSELATAFTKFETSPGSESLKALRDALKMNQVEMATALSVCQGLVSQVEKGRTPVSKRLKTKVAELKAKKLTA